MRGVLTIARREIVERRQVLMAAAVAGITPLLLPLIPGLEHHRSFAVSGGMAGFFALTLVPILALVLGATIITRDLAEGRLGFLFSRPVAASSIWWGKILAAVALIVGSELLIFAPVVITSGVLLRIKSLHPPPWYIPASFLGIPLFILLAAHAVATMGRSRSPWLIADLCIAAFLGLAGWGACQRLLLEDAPEAMKRGLIWLFPLAVVALLIAGNLQIARGRADFRRSHRVLSSTLWALLAVGVLGLEVYSRWVVAACPRDLLTQQVRQVSPVGDWVLVEGTTRGRADYRATFLAHVESDRFVRFARGQLSYFADPDIFFSTDGTRAAWFEDVAGSGDATAQLMTLDLATPGAKPVPTVLTFNTRSWRRLAVSPDCRRLAQLDNGILSVHEVDSGQLLTSVGIGSHDEFLKIDFATADRLRLCLFEIDDTTTPREEPYGSMRVLEVDVGQHRLVECGRVEGLAWYHCQGHLDHGGRRMLVINRANDAEHLTVHNASSGELLAQLVPWSDNARFRSPRATFLEDGRIVASRLLERQLDVLVFTATGELERRIPIGPAVWRSVGGEPAPGVVAVTVEEPTTHEQNESHTYLVNTATGSATRLSEPVSSWWSTLWQPWFAAPPPPAAGSLGSRLMVTEDGRALVLDPATGALRPLFKPS